MLTMSRIEVVTDVNHISPVMCIAYSRNGGKNISDKLLECHNLNVDQLLLLHHLHPQHFMVHCVYFYDGTLRVVISKL